MSEPIGPIDFLGTIPIKDGALQAHGEMGFRVVIDISESDLPAYMRLHLMRGRVIRFRAEATDEIATPRSKRKKPQQEETQSPEIETWKTPKKLKN